jgi:hypothetical protein
VKYLCVLGAALLVVLTPISAEAAWPSSASLVQPSTGSHVDCVANISSEGYARLLCADPWPHAVIKTQYWDEVAQSWHFNSRWTWNGPEEGQLLSVFIGEKPNDGRTWRVAYKVRDGDPSNGRCDGRATLGWYRGG